MRRIVLLISILLLFATWTMAQDDSGLNSQINSTNKVTVKGCLNGEVGELTLTDRAGNAYQLTGNTQKMIDNVGHTVLVTGVKPSGVPAPGSMAADEDADSDTPPSLSVISFEDVSPNCDEMEGNNSR
jgi:hypothetical protein